MNPLIHLNNYDIILGSASPRRKELLELLRIKFRVIRSKKEETYDKTLDPHSVPGFLSKMKYDDILKHHALKDDFLLITADTIVVANNKILGKPNNTDDAHDMLLQLSDKIHEVHTGVTIGTLNSIFTFVESTKVSVGSLSLNEIKWYADNFKILDKAGAYGIQDWLGVAKIKSLQGTYYNVMGLPVNRIYEYLMKL